MVIPYVFNANNRDLGPFDTAVRARRTRIVGWSEDQSPTSGKIKRELSEPVTLKRVGVASNQIGDTCRRFESHQPNLQLTRRGRPELLLGDGLLFT